MAYRKFDDAPLTAKVADRRLHDVEWQDGLRRAIQSLTNRVIWAGTGGTHGSCVDIQLGTGGTCGVAIPLPIFIAINGRVGTAYAQDNIRLPNGTQSKSTYVKYLVCVGFGTQGTIVAGNEGTDSTSAYLPDCPEGMVPVGYMEYATGTAGAYKRFGGGTAGAYNVLSGDAAATCGTVNDWVSLIHMPYKE